MKMRGVWHGQRGGVWKHSATGQSSDGREAYQKEGRGWCLAVRPFRKRGAEFAEEEAEKGRRECGADSGGAEFAEDGGMRATSVEEVRERTPGARRGVCGCQWRLASISHTS